VAASTPEDGMMTMAPPQASTLAGSVDTLFDVMLALTGTISVAVFVVMIFFCVKYRRRSHADRSNANQTRLGVEVAWTVVPFLMFMALFGWSISLWSRMRTPPADAAPIYVVAKQWMWKVQHPGGQREIDSLHVPLGQPIRLVMTSQDVIHDFYVPAFRQKQDVLPGRYTQLWFTATREGEYPLL
jgi:cytochrome c oxidase subunit 2